MSRVVSVPLTDERRIKAVRWYRLIDIPGHPTPLEQEIAAYNAAHPLLGRVHDDGSITVTWGPSMIEFLEWRKRNRRKG
jgi:hypothetical protein